MTRKERKESKLKTQRVKQDIINQHQLIQANLRIPISEGSPISFKFSVLYNEINTLQYDREED